MGEAAGAVLDASALLAYIQVEAGREIADAILLSRAATARRRRDPPTPEKFPKFAMPQTIL